jgi:hypothetical protein
MKKMMKMKNRIVLYRWMLAAWLLVGHALPNYAQTGGSRTASGLEDQWAMTNLHDQTATAPSYQFRSTSPYTAKVNATSTVRIPSYAPSGLRRGPWDPPEDNPIGVLPDAAPIGEPLILLLFALAFVAFRYYRRRKA